MSVFKFFTDLQTTQKNELQLSRAIELLQHREQLFNTGDLTDVVFDTPVYEYNDSVYAKIYFDIDASLDQFPLNEDHSRIVDPDYLSSLVAECFRIRSDQVLSICRTDHPAKLSLHITLDFRGSQDERKNAAFQLGRFLNRKWSAFKPQYVDTAVYGKTQKWRTIYTSKRGQHRIKYPLKGGIADSLITIVPPAILTGIETTRTGNPDQNTRSTKLNWFKAALDHAGLSDFWRTRVAYNEWTSVCQSLVVESSRNNCQDYGCSLYLLYIVKAGFADAVQARQTFETHFRGCQVDRFNEIHGWVKEYNKDIFKQLEPIFQGKITRVVDRLIFNAEEVNGNDDVELPSIDGFQAVTYIEWVIATQITTSAKMYHYWYERLQGGDWTLLLGVIQGDPGKRAYDSLVPALLKTYGDLPLNHYPYGRRIDTSGEAFLHWLADSLQIPFQKESVEIQPECSETSFSLYKEASYIIDPACYNDVFGSERNAHPVLPLALREYVSPRQIINRIRSTEAFYTMHLPYKAIFGALDEVCHGDDTAFYIALSHYNKEFLTAEKLFHYITRAYDDSIAADIVIDLYGNWLLGTTQQVFVFNDITGTWSPEQRQINNIVERYQSFLEYQIGEKGTKNFATNKVCQNNVAELIARSSTIWNKGDGDFLAKKLSGQYKLPFRNGYYDGIEDRFYPAYEVSVFGSSKRFFTNVNIVFFGFIENDYVPFELIDHQMYEEMLRVLFFQVHDAQTAEYVIELYAMALFGHRFKGFFEQIGNTNSGKGTLMQLNKAAFGPLVGIFTVNDLCPVANDSRSAGRRNQFLVDIAFCRLAESSEKPCEGRKVDTEKVKGFASGSTDPQRASKLFQNDASYPIDFIMNFYVNGPLDFDNPHDAALKARRNTVIWKKVFVDPDEYRDPDTQLLKDPAVVSWYADKTRCLVYIHIIIQYFKKIRDKNFVFEKPEVVDVSDTADIRPFTTEETIERLLQSFVITGNPEHSIPAKDLQDIFAKMNIQNPGRELTNIKDYAKKLGVAIVSKQKQRAGERKQVWTGILPREKDAQFSDYSMFNDFAHWKQFIGERKVITDTEISKQTMVERLLLTAYDKTPEELALIEEVASPVQKQMFARYGVGSSKRQRTESSSAVCSFAN